MLITTEVEVGIRGSNAKWFEDKGYKILRHKNKRGIMSVKKGTKIRVKVEDLPDKSSVKVDVQCDGCEGYLKNIVWSSYLYYIKENGEYFCNKCAANGYKKWTSFYKWCYENLSKEEADKLLSRWDYEKNVDKNGKKLSPKDVSFRSSGFNKKGYWFKCLDHPEHESELHSISDFVNNHKGVMDCHLCNSVSITHPYLIKFLVNEEDIYKYSYGSNKIILMKCPSCGYEKDRNFKRLITEGFPCPRCGDGISYPQKFMFNILEQLNINFQTELNKTTFKWCDNYRYDFYLYDSQCIIETHGLQHYEESFTRLSNKAKSLKETQQNDKNKEMLAKENNIDNYYIIDSRNSDLEWIKNSIMQSELPIILNFKESDIDWLKCLEYACSSLVKKACDLWDGGIRSTLEIAKSLKIGRGVSIKYLKQGAKLGWCDYDRQFKEIICLTTSEKFNNLSEANRKYNINISHISECCKGKLNYAGNHPETGENMVWMFYEEYLNKLI